MRSVMSKKLIFLLLAAVWVAVPSAVASLKYDTLTSADGLSNSSVNCIYQDSTLMMWFGTWDGLNAYNGYGFRTYKFAPDNANTISNNVIRNIVEEAKGILWVATDYGINRPATDRESQGRPRPAMTPRMFRPRSLPPCRPNPARKRGGRFP